LLPFHTYNLYIIYIVNHKFPKNEVKATIPRPRLSTLPNNGSIAATSTTSIFLFRPSLKKRNRFKPFYQLLLGRTVPPRSSAQSPVPQINSRPHSSSPQILTHSQEKILFHRSSNLNKILTFPRPPPPFLQGIATESATMIIIVDSRNLPSKPSLWFPPLPPILVPLSGSSLGSRQFMYPALPFRIGLLFCGGSFADPPCSFHGVIPSPTDLARSEVLNVTHLPPYLSFFRSSAHSASCVPSRCAFLHLSFLSKSKM